MNTEKVILKIASDIIAKERPSTLFEQAFFDMRVKVKGIKKQEAQHIKQNLNDKLIKDLASLKIHVKSVDVKLGAFRGSEFVTSAKILVFLTNQNTINKLEKYLQKMYSPKYKFKGIEGNIATFNVR